MLQVKTLIATYDDGSIYIEQRNEYKDLILSFSLTEKEANHLQKIMNERNSKSFTEDPGVVLGEDGVVLEED